MGSVFSREDDSFGLAEMFAIPKRRTPILARLAMIFPWIRILDTSRRPAQSRQTRDGEIDSMGEMRAMLSALGGWGEDTWVAHEQRLDGGLPLVESKDFSEASDGWPSSASVRGFLRRRIAIRPDSTASDVELGKRTSYFFPSLVENQLGLGF